MSRLGRVVESVLRQRRIRRVRIDPESDAELRTAILLRSARVGAGSVREEFVTSLQQRLSAELATDPAPPAPVTRRRRFVQLAMTAAASVGVGVGIDRLVVSGAAVAAPPPATPRELMPDNGIWLAVLPSGDLPEGGVHRFDLGTVTGFVRRTNGTVGAVSGICTHFACRLVLNEAANELDCPCHRAAFSVTGAVLRHELPIQLGPLPGFEVREVNGMVEVFAPRTPGS